MAESFDRGGSPLYARLAREYADEPLVAEIAGEHEPRWEVPLRLFGGVHYLALSGDAPDAWSSFRDVLATHRDWLARFVAEQPVQTNEVQRSWALLPAFLTVADGRALDLVELGPSAGLNLYWDRYRYRYDGARWGAEEAPLELAGEAVDGPPPDLFETSVEVRGRVGIDRSPVDVATEHGARLLQAFVWPDQTGRLERLRRAIEIVRRDPPRLVRGDYLDVLPELLEKRDANALTVVYHSASTAYLDDEGRARLYETIEQAGRDGSLAWISYEFVEGEEVAYENFAIDVRVFPGGEPRRLARLDGHGNRMTWLA